MSAEEILVPPIPDIVHEEEEEQEEIDFVRFLSVSETDYYHAARAAEKKKSIQWQVTSVDDTLLSRVGKRPVLKRNFGFMSILGFSCTILLTWEGWLTTFEIGFVNGGPAGLVWAYIFVWIGSMSIYICLGELVSMAPTSGGQYHFVSMLAPASCQRFLSYITGWLTVCGWQAAFASQGILNASILQGVIEATHPSYVPHRWHVTLLAIAFAVWAVAVNSIIGGLLPKFEGAILIVHILGFFGTLLPIVVLGPRMSAEDVFNVWVNSGGWKTQGLSFCIGLTGTIYSFLGADGAIHMSEEIQNAAVVVPRSILISVFINGTLGFGIMLATLFCLGPFTTITESKYVYPIMSVYQQAVHSTAGATFMMCIILFMAFGSAPGYMASASRIYWAFARDRAVPGWQLFVRLDRRTSIPIYAVGVVALVSSLLSLIEIGSDIAMQIVFSITIAALFTSYLISSSLLLWRRWTGAIHVRAPPTMSDDGLVNTTGRSLLWGPWYIPGVLGILNNLFACCYMVMVLFFSFWPPDKQVTGATMNYSCACFVGVILAATVYYIFWAKNEYSGPIIEVTAWKPSRDFAEHEST